MKIKNKCITCCPFRFSTGSKRLKFHWTHPNILFSATPCKRKALIFTEDIIASFQFFNISFFCHQSSLHLAVLILPNISFFFPFQSQGRNSHLCHRVWLSSEPNTYHNLMKKVFLVEQRKHIRARIVIVLTRDRIAATFKFPNKFALLNRVHQRKFSKKYLRAVPDTFRWK